MGRLEPVRSQASGSMPQLPPWAAEFLEAAAEWARGRMWIPRALLLLYLVYAEVRFLRDPLSSTIFSGITLAFHEMGHLLFSFAGHFIGSLMGSGMQVLIPVMVMVVFYRQADYFGMAVGGFWLSFSLFELATYVGDARAMELPLVGFTDDPEHDWHYLLSTLGLLNFDTAFAFLIRVVATLSGVVSLAFAVWLLLVMARGSRARVLAG
ncbi:MAG TPA: hypothetical protein VNA04_03555 [Thermoanaerobaculia bacterium]|nr:hypothetical protein [Thermoanaerobaculia bacterium]